MNTPYPAGPTSVPADFTMPSKAYRRHAWIAMATLVAFVALYFMLAAWFARTSWRLLALLVGPRGGDDFLGLLIGGLGAGFLAVFMFRALFFVRKGEAPKDLEVSATEEPVLHDFLNRLADEVGAPRPHRVFVSSRVNAAVFYDLSLLNLVFPSRKNLEIGLGLVNVLTLGELKAVLAHEFGHFAQRTMAVGRWVYIAHQIAAHLVSRRDAFDNFLAQLSRTDFRVAWIGWTLSLVVWSIRSLVEIAFRGVVLAERALSREMEFQADLVAVSVTGSDALIHALHRLGAADDALDRAFGFVNKELAAGRPVADLFEVQGRIIALMKQVLGQPGYGEVPALPAHSPQTHRVFKPDLASPPRMWSTHPPSFDREEGAKRIYLAAAIDDRHAWVLFRDPPALRAQATMHLLPKQEATPDQVAPPFAETLIRLDQEYSRVYLDPAFRGVYLASPAVRNAKVAAALIGALPPPERIRSELDALYPESLAATLAQLREVEQERALLEALRLGQLTAPNGVIRHRDRELSRHELPATIAALDRELTALRQTVIDHDRRCRATHLALAERAGAGWPERLRGLVTLMHYAEHTEADLRDAQGLLGNTVSIITADGSVSSQEMVRLLAVADSLYQALKRINDQRDALVLDESLLQRLGIAAWGEALGEFTLPSPANQNISQWLQHIDSWVGPAAGALNRLRYAALEDLLEAERLLAKQARAGAALAAAPPPPQVPSDYPTLVPGAERTRQLKLGWLDRFHTADGWFPTLLKTSVAGAILAGTVLLGASNNFSAKLAIHNGLGQAVDVVIDGASTRVGPQASRTIDLDTDGDLEIVTRTLTGEEIERFDAPVATEHRGYAYNVAGANVLLEWTAVYGKNPPPSAPRPAGAARWRAADQDHVFSEPPESVRGNSGTRRTVLTAPPPTEPGRMLSSLSDAAQREAMIDAHLRWDPADDRHAYSWLMLAQQYPWFGEALARQLAAAPADVMLMRLEQDSAGAGHAAVCARHVARAAAAPTDADLRYLAIRCMPDGPEQSDAFVRANAAAPDHAWSAFAAGMVHASRNDFDGGLQRIQYARSQLPVLHDQLAPEEARLERVIAAMQGVDPDFSKRMLELGKASEYLAMLLALEWGANMERDPYSAFSLMAGGDLDGAIVRSKFGVPGTSGARDADHMARVLRFVAASDGASAAHVEQAFALTPTAGLDDNTAWSALALALREGRDTAPMRQVLVREPPDPRAERVLGFLQALAAGEADAVAEQRLIDLDARLRGHAYAAGAVLRGKAAPPHWRGMAKALLFASERPRFE